MAEKQFDDALGHAIIAKVVSLPTERENYEKWITQTEAYMIAQGEHPNISRETEMVWCGDQTNNSCLKEVKYSATFQW